MMQLYDGDNERFISPKQLAAKRLYRAKHGTYKTNRRWADQFDDMIMFIGAHALAVPEIATVHEDTKLNFDAKLKLKGDGTMCMRIRDNTFLRRYLRSFTIRWELPCGRETEIHKILRGLGSVLVYCFADPFDNYVQRAFVLDLNVFRDKIQTIEGGEAIGEPHTNESDGVKFLGFDHDQFDESLVLADFNLHVKDSWMLGMFMSYGLVTSDVVPKWYFPPAVETPPVSKTPMENLREVREAKQATMAVLEPKRLRFNTLQQEQEEQA